MVFLGGSEKGKEKKFIRLSLHCCLPPFFSVHNLWELEIFLSHKIHANFYIYSKTLSNLIKVIAI